MVGAAVPQNMMEAIIKADQSPQIQTHKLSWAIIQGIESTGHVIDLISTAPISDYPRSDWAWCGYLRWDRANSSDNRLAPFINILGLKQLTRWMSCVFMLLRWSMAHRGKMRHVLVYGLLSPHLYAVRCVRLLFRMTATVLITDLPGLAVAREPWWRSVWRPIDRYMVHRALREADGLVVLTRQIAEDCAPTVPSIVMEGIVSVESEERAKTIVPRNARAREFTILYAGVLARVYGIPLLLDAFAKLPGEEFRLWLCGWGDMAEDIRRQAAEDARVCCLGVICPEEAFERCQRATVLINPRPSDACFARYSFPSKLLEYMAAGRPVITTRLPGIPAEYDPYVVWLDRETPDGLAALLSELQRRPPEELDDLGERGRNFVLREKNYRRQGERIVDFIGAIQSGTTEAAVIREGIDHFPRQ
jgi:glycosyltransferase involved in cell wall biosynthesis